jgi:RNA polymerase sigma factor (sigma-70 family)
MDWIRGLKQDEPQIVQELWELLYTSGLNLARRYRQPPDVGSEAMIAAYKRIRQRGIYQFQFACPFLGYCHQILVREVLRLINKKNKRPAELELENQALESPKKVNGAAVRERLQPCWQKLLPRERKVLILRYQEEQKPKAIADQLAIQRNHVNQIAFTARRKLHNCLQTRGYQRASDILEGS